MRNTFIWSLLSVGALAAGGLVAGCDSDAKLVRSSLGDSCDTTADCNDNLRCIDHTCYAKTPTSSGGSSNGQAGDSTGGTVVTGPKPPVLGSEGESCTKRADCEDGLACLAQRCQKDVTAGAGGEGNAPGGPTLGGPGETCGLTSDCAAGLACLPSDGFSNFPQAKAIGSNSVGVCAPIDNGLTATGKACGAECAKPEDCCELPVSVQVANSVLTPFGIGANSCTELATLLDGVKCDAAVLTAQNAARCFAQTAYCDCAKATWSCSDAGKCIYDADCTKSGSTPGGCPTYTRAGVAPTAVCNDDSKCELAAGTPTCTADADCDKGEYVADSVAAEKCTAGECTCYKKAGLCYRKCGEDLDCKAGTSCETKTKVCVQNPECTSDAFCVTKYNDINEKCSPEGVCQAACDNDRDCNGGALTSYAGTRVCNANHACELVGCTSDDDCANIPGPGGVRVFCGPVAATTAEAGVSSAVTD